MALLWVSVLAISILFYVVLDRFDLGVGIRFGFTRSESRRRAMLAAVAPLWDGNETWLIVAGVVLWGAFPVVYATLFSAFYLALLVMLAGLTLRGWRSNSGTRRRGCVGSGTLALPEVPFVAAFHSRRRMRIQSLVGIRTPRGNSSSR